MPISNILITTDNYWVGGRESFLAANLSFLSERNQTHARLLAEDITHPMYRESIFREAISIGLNRSVSICSWLNEGKNLISRTKPDLIWAQHYRVLPAWLLSIVNEIPLLITFHGSLFGAGVPNNLQDVLGITLAIHRGGVLSAVSQEIARELALIGARKEDIRLIPNRVYLGGQSNKQAEQLEQCQRVRLALFSRAQKLDHIRAAVNLLRAVRKKGCPASLEVYSGIKASKHDDCKRFRVDAAHAAKQLGRKWLLKKPQLIPLLRHIKYFPLTLEPERAIENSTIVLGMGRVVLEGIAAGKPAILIGYDKVIGRVTKERFDEFQFSNFSGRGVDETPVNMVAEEVVQAVHADDGENVELKKLVDINEAEGNLNRILDDTVCMEWDSELRSEINKEVDLVCRKSIDETEFVETIKNFLTKKERKTYRMLLERREALSNNGNRY